MRKQRKTTRVVCTAMLAVALASLGLAGSAQAKLVEPFIKFQYCPWKNTEVARCVYAVTNSGEVKLGNKAVPIEKPVVLQGGISEPNSETKFSKFSTCSSPFRLSANEINSNLARGAALMKSDNSELPLAKASRKKSSPKRFLRYEIAALVRCRSTSLRSIVGSCSIYRSKFR